MRQSLRAAFPLSRPSVLSVVDELAGAEPSSSLPVIVSAAARALGVDQLCVHLLSGSEPPTLRRFAAVGLPELLLAANEELPVGPGGGPVGLAAESGSVVVEEDIRDSPAWTPFTGLGQSAEVLSCWAVPVVGKDGLLGVVSGYGATTGPPRGDLVELVFLYAGYTAAAIERGRLQAQADVLTAALRRTRTTPVPVAEPTVTIGDVVVDLDARAVTRAGEMIHLTPTEFSLLRELALHRGKLLSHATLLRRVWGPGYETETEYIRVYVRRLRSKLESPGGPSLIRTEPRVGYRLIAE
jgi:DNA-binding winged helix-turn-helix (wHTH) protein